MTIYLFIIRIVHEVQEESIKASNVLDALVMCKQKRLLLLFECFETESHCISSNPQVSSMLVILYSQIHICQWLPDCNKVLAFYCRHW